MVDMSRHEPTQSLLHGSDRCGMATTGIFGARSQTGGRPATYARREIVNAIFYGVRTGGSWRLLPHDLPPWRSVFYYFWQWRKAGSWAQIHDTLRGELRQAAGRQRQPSAGMMDSQSVKTTEKGGSVGMRRVSSFRGLSATS